MDIDKSRVVIEPGPTTGSTQASHREFPEIHAQSADPGDAARQLVNQLTRALDSALNVSRREAIEAAIADARAFADGGA